MAQGIMTGIGFLGAGVIMKEKLSIRGLTTAASIWMTASIGIVVGMGFFSAACIATLLTLAVLGILGWFERKIPTFYYSRLMVRYKNTDILLKDDLYNIIEDQKFKSTNPSYQLEDGGKILKFQLTIHTRDPANLQRLADNLSRQEHISEFSIIPVGE